MKAAELLRACADAMELVEKHDLGFEPCLSLVWPKGSKGRFPLYGELQCVNASEDKVYRVKVAHVLTYVSRQLKKQILVEPAQVQSP